MKSFLDRFRRKRIDGPSEGGNADSTRDATKEAGKSLSKSALLKKRESDGKPGPHPAAAAESGAAPSPAPAPGAGSEDARREEVVSFELADFLHRIPEQFLKPGPHDGTLKLTFEVQELSARIARGQTTLALPDLYQRLPQIFQEAVPAANETQIQFPWQKLLELVKAATSNAPTPELTDSAAEELSAKLRNRRRNLAPGAASSGPAKKPSPSTALRSIPGQPSWFNRTPATPPGSFAGSEQAASRSAVPDSSLAHVPPEGVTATERELPAPKNRPPESATSSGPGAELTALHALLEEQRELLDQRSKELDTLRGEIDAIRRAHDEQLAGVTKEREALLAQKAHLTEQIAQMQKAAGARADISGSEGDRSRRDFQRQNDELQRRIAALETSQKESAQELGREREAKIKAERTTAAAERARTEATALVESIRNEMRRDSDAQSRKRDADTPRLQKELSEKVASLTDACRKAVAERDELTAEIAALRKTAAEAGAESAKGVDPDWESRAVASLEADIENYRNRVRALLKERDDLVKDKEQLAATPGDTEAMAELKISNEKLTADFAALRTERDRIQQQFAEASEKLARAESGSAIALAAQEQRIAGELDQVKAETRKLRDEHERLKHAESEGALKIVELAQQLEVAKAAAIDPKKLLEAEAEVGRLRESIVAAEKSAAEKLASAVAERDAALIDKEALNKQGESGTAEEVQGKTAALAAQLAGVASERDNAVRKRDDLAQEILALRAEMERKAAEVPTGSVAGVEGDAKLDAMRAQLEASAKEKSALAAELEAARGNLDRRISQSEREHANFERAIDDIKARSDRDGVRLRQERDTLVRLRDELRARIARLIEEQSRMLEEMTAQSVKAAVNPINVDVSPRGREAREPNVIDISEAEVMTGFTPGELPSGGVRPPRIRPVAIPPPNVHVL